MKIIESTEMKFTTFSKKTNSNEHILTEHLNDMMNQKNLITLPPIVTIKIQ